MRVILIACGLIIPLLCAGQPAQPSKIPPCRQMPDDPANYASNMVRPKYPKDALRNGVAGNVELRAVIAPDGRMKDLAVFSGNPELASSAIVAIRKWRFHPETRQGQSVETAFKIHVRFSLLLREANSDVELESPPLESVIQPKSGPDVVGPRQIYTPEPEFSEADRKKGAQGNVGIALVVGADGLPRNLQVTCSSLPDSNENALTAVRQWKFAPGTKDGKPISVPIEVEVSFKRF